MTALAAAGVGTACRATSVPIAPVASLDHVAERYVRLALALAQHQPSLLEAYLGPEQLRPGPRVPVAGIRRDIDELAGSLRAREGHVGDEAVRLSYLGGQVRGLQTAVRRLAGETMRFADEARDAFGVTWSPPTAPDVAAARQTLERELPGRGPLSARYAAFRRKDALTPAACLPALRSAVEACRSHVRAEIGLPDAEQVEIAELAGGGLEGQSVYIGGFRTRVAIATAQPTDLARLVWLAAHETYPGHHLQHVLADRDLVSSGGWLERTLQPAFGRHVLIAEGAAEAGAALLLEGDAFAALCRPLARAAGTSENAVLRLVTVHRAVSELDAVIPAVAEAYLDGAIGTEAALVRLREDALVPDPSQLLDVIERQRSRLLAYPMGRRLVVGRVFEAAPGKERWARLGDISRALTLAD